MVRAGAVGRARRRRRPGWVPNQHGAWVMLMLPFVVGVLNTGPRWQHLPLLGAWLIGYLAFFAAGLWLRSRCQSRYWPPVRTYGALMIVAGLAVVAIQPSLLLWAVVFVPLLVTSLWCSWRRADRTLLNDGVTIVAACLMTVVVSGVGTEAAQSSAGWLPGADQAHAWALAGLLAAYFFGTVLFVKTMIRDRGNPAMYVLSVGYHVVICVPAVLAGLWMGLMFAALAARAALIPRVWPKLTPRTLGIVEICSSVALTALLIFT